VISPEEVEVSVYFGVHSLQPEELGPQWPTVRPEEGLPPRRPTLTDPVLVFLVVVVAVVLEALRRRGFLSCLGARLIASLWRLRHDRQHAYLPVNSSEQTTHVASAVDHSTSEGEDPAALAFFAPLEVWGEAVKAKLSQRDFGISQFTRRLLSVSTRASTSRSSARGDSPFYGDCEESEEARALLQVDIDNDNDSKVEGEEERHRPRRGGSSLRSWSWRHGRGRCAEGLHGNEEDDSAGLQALLSLRPAAEDSLGCGDDGEDLAGGRPLVGTERSALLRR